MRNGSGGHISNGVIANVAEGIEIEDKETPEDAFDRWVAGDLTLMDITVIGDDAIDYDGLEVADGDEQLDAYAADNNVVVNNDLAVDYLFAFDASGTSATDTLNLECGSGSGHLWALGWTFCDAVNLFGGQGTSNVGASIAGTPVALWPNPVLEGGLRIGGLPIGANLSVYSMTGAFIWKGRVSSAIETVDTEGLMPGTYLVSWDVDGVFGRQRFIVQ
jgi:hypothetical protein